MDWEQWYMGQSLHKPVLAWELGQIKTDDGGNSKKKQNIPIFEFSTEFLSSSDLK